MASPAGTRRAKRDESPLAAARPNAAAARENTLDDLFGALSDPIRRGIVDRLSQGPCSVGELGRPYEVSGPAISRHLNVLQRCGLIERWKVGRVHYCRILPEPLAEAGAWIAQHQVFWERQLDALAEYLDRENAAPDKGGRTCKPAKDRDR